MYATLTNIFLAKCTAGEQGAKLNSLSKPCYIKTDFLSKSFFAF